MRKKNKRKGDTKGKKMLKVALILQIKLFPWPLIWGNNRIYRFTRRLGVIPKKGHGKSLGCLTDVG